MREEREAVAAGDNLERHRKDAAHRIPFQIELGAVDRKRRGLGGLGQKASLRDDAALQRLGRAVRADLTAQARRYRDLRHNRVVAEPQRQQQVLGHYAARFQGEHAPAGAQWRDRRR